MEILQRWVCRLAVCQKCPNTGLHPNLRCERHAVNQASVVCSAFQPNAGILGSSVQCPQKKRSPITKLLGIGSWPGGFGLGMQMTLQAMFRQCCSRRWPSDNRPETTAASVCAFDHLVPLLVYVIGGQPLEHVF